MTIEDSGVFFRRVEMGRINDPRKHLFVICRLYPAFFDFTHSDLIQNIFILKRDFLYFFALRVDTINFIGLRQRVTHGDQTVVVNGSQ